MDRTNYEAILDQEIAALKQEVNAPFGHYLNKCYAIVSQPLYAPKTNPEILDEFSKISGEVSSGAITQSLRNIIVLRAALVLPLLLENARKALPQFYEYIKTQNERELSAWIRSIGAKAMRLSSITAHRRPLDLLVNKAVRIQGDPFEDAVEFLRNLELNLKRFQKDGSFANADLAGDAVVEQAFQRILRTITATKNTQNRQQQLAEKCRQLKSLFPDAEDHIDKMFRKEAESLDEL